jgi:hypothetical protein
MPLFFLQTRGKPMARPTLFAFLALFFLSANVSAQEEGAEHCLEEEEDPDLRWQVEHQDQTLLTVFGHDPNKLEFIHLYSGINKEIRIRDFTPEQVYEVLEAENTWADWQEHPNWTVGRALGSEHPAMLQYAERTTGIRMRLRVRELTPRQMWQVIKAANEWLDGIRRPVESAPPSPPPVRGQKKSFLSLVSWPSLAFFCYMIDTSRH